MITSNSKRSGWNVTQLAILRCRLLLNFALAKCNRKNAKELASKELQCLISLESSAPGTIESVPLFKHATRIYRFKSKCWDHVLPTTYSQQTSTLTVAPGECSHSTDKEVCS